MSCINVNIQRENTSPILKIYKLNESIEGVITCFNTISGKIFLDQKFINANILPKVTNININCSIVCSISNDEYLRVSPEEVQWLSPDWYIIYEVKSNTDWIIE